MKVTYLASRYVQTPKFSMRTPCPQYFAMYEHFHSESFEHLFKHTHTHTHTRPHFSNEVSYQWGHSMEYLSNILLVEILQVCSASSKGIAPASHFLLYYRLVAISSSPAAVIVVVVVVVPVCCFCVQWFNDSPLSALPSLTHTRTRTHTHTYTLLFASFSLYLISIRMLSSASSNSPRTPSRPRRASLPLRTRSSLLRLLRPACILNSPVFFRLARASTKYSEIIISIYVHRCAY